MPSPAARAFRSGAAFRAWLQRHHASATALVVRLYKKEFARRGMTYPDALDEALCFGWIDGVRRGLDETSFTIRFSPRQPRSIWSNINVAHMERLLRERRVTSAGLAVFGARDPARTGIYSFERETATFTVAQLRRFRGQRQAWDFFEVQPAGYRRRVTHWVTSARQEATRERRLAALIAKSGKRARI